MDDREILQWDKRLMDQARQGWENYKHLHIDLDTARADQSYLIAGEYLYVEQSSGADAIAKIKLNRNSNDALDLEKGVKIETVFIEIFITNDALEGEWLDLVFGINFKYKKKIAFDYVKRGETVVNDYTGIDFICNDAFHDLDLSAIIPNGTKLVHFSVIISSDPAGKTGWFKTRGQVNNIIVNVCETQVPNVTIPFTDLFVVPDTNRFIEYAFNAVGWIGINFVVKGWYI